MNNTVSKEEWFGRYLMTLTDNQRNQPGRRFNVIARFVEHKAELSKTGYREYLQAEGYSLTDGDRQYLVDFLGFAGVRGIGSRRAPRRKVAERLDQLTEKNKVRISAFMEWVRTQRDYSVHSLKMKSDHMIKFFKYFNEFNLVNCRNFIATMEHEGKSPATLNMYMLTLKQYGEYVKKPVKLKQISIPRRLSVENVPTEREYQRFLEWLWEHRKWRMYWCVRILGSTGMRRSELWQLTWKDVLSGEFYPLCKGKKHRLVFFPKPLVEDLKEWMKEHPTDIDAHVVGTGRGGATCSGRGFSLTMQHNAENAGYPKEKAHCHAFRHFFAKQYLSKNKDVVELAELLGHENVETTRIYLQKSKAEQVRSINKYITW